MFQQGSLIYISDFDFSTIDNSLSVLNNFRDKYILVLENYGNESYLFCCFATTLSDKTEFHKVAVPECNKGFFKYNVFHFEKGKPVTDASFIFPKPTFVAGNKGQVFTYDIVKLYKNYHLNKLITHHGIMYQQLLFNVIHCLHLSTTLENEFRRQLYDVGDAVMTAIQKNSIV